MTEFLTSSQSLKDGTTYLSFDARHKTFFLNTSPTKKLDVQGMSSSNELGYEEMFFRLNVDCKGADEPAHLCGLIVVFSGQMKHL